MKTLVVASYSGDARDFLRVDLRIHEREAIIVTPVRREGLRALRGDQVSVMYDIRRAAGAEGSSVFLDNDLMGLRAKHPDIKVEVLPW